MTADGREFDYKATLDAMTLALRQFNMFAQLVTDEEIAKAEETLSRVDSFGHIFDPTVYRAGLNDGRFDRQRLLLKTFTDCRAGVQKLTADLEQRIAAIVAKAEATP